MPGNGEGKESLAAAVSGIQPALDAVRTAAVSLEQATTLAEALLRNDSSQAGTYQLQMVIGQAYQDVQKANTIARELVRELRVF